MDSKLHIGFPPNSEVEPIYLIQERADLELDKT